MSPKPIYATNTAKALECILWMVEQRDGFDIYHIVKAAYFADKFHITHYGRPICGDAYDAGPYGPLPQVMYGLLKHDPIELLALDGNGDLPFKIDSRFRVSGTRGANLRKLSKTDLEALSVGLGHVKDLDFEAIYNETHADPAYLNADGGRMDYRDFLPSDTPDRQQKADMIAETAAAAVF